MKRKAGVVLLLAALLAAMGLSNPTTEDFVDYIRAQWNKDPEGKRTEIEQLLAKGANWFKLEWAKQNIRRENYFLFSVFSIKIEGEERSYLGILSQFMALSPDR